VVHCTSKPLVGINFSPRDSIDELLGTLPAKFLPRLEESARMPGELSLWENIYETYDVDTEAVNNLGAER
jgi:hypothetical protein